MPSDLVKQFEIVNVIANCWNPDQPSRKLAGIDTIILHRIEKEVGQTAAQVAKWFGEDPVRSGLGVPHMPYHFIIRDYGMIEQALPLICRAPHAYMWNSRAIGVALIGDFRTQRPTDAQRDACIVLCRRLRDTLSKELRIAGHTALKDATRTPGKVCPGQWLSPDAIAKEVWSMGTLITE